MAAGNIRQSFYRERSVPFLHSLPPPSRIPPRSDFSAGLPIFKVFFFSSPIWRSLQSAATSRFSKCKEASRFQRIC